MKIDCIIEFRCRDKYNFNKYETIKRKVKIDSPNNKIIYCYEKNGYICDSDKLIQDIYKTYNISKNRVIKEYKPNQSILGYEKDYLKFLLIINVHNDVIRKMKIESLLNINN